jgi:hypothetical protein
MRKLFGELGEAIDMLQRSPAAISPLPLDDNEYIRYDLQKIQDHAICHVVLPDQYTASMNFNRKCEVKVLELLLEPPNCLAFHLSDARGKTRAYRMYTGSPRQRLSNIQQSVSITREQLPNYFFK